MEESRSDERGDGLQPPTSTTTNQTLPPDDPESPTSAPISLEDLILQLHVHPSASTNANDAAVFDDHSPPESSLSFVPWKLVVRGSSTPEALSSTVPATKTFDSSKTAADSPQKASSESAPNSDSGNPFSLAVVDDNGPPSIRFPSYSYLDLRRRQNEAWADQRLEEGNRVCFVDPTKAEELYEQGLELVPDHVELLVAQAKLWSHPSVARLHPEKIAEAVAQLRDVVSRLDPSHKAARQHLERMEQHLARRQQNLGGSRGGGIIPGITSKKKGLSVALESSSAYRDALMERNLAMDDLGDMEGTETQKGGVDANDSDSERQRRGSRRDKKKHKSSKKHKKSKKDHKSEKKSKHKRRRRKHHRRRRRRYSSSSSGNESISSSFSTHSSLSDGDGAIDDSSTDNNRRHRRRERKRWSTRNHHDSDASSESEKVKSHGSNADPKAENTQSPRDEKPMASDRENETVVDVGDDSVGSRDGGSVHNSSQDSISSSHRRSRKHRSKKEERGRKKYSRRRSKRDNNRKRKRQKSPTLGASELASKS